MTKRIFRSILTVTLTVLVASLVLIVGVLHGYFQDRVLEELARSTAYIARGVEENGMAYLNDDLPKSSRITWVASDGTVLYDNWEDEASMGNHADREEVQEALMLGRGSASRYSDTLSQKTVYYAPRSEEMWPLPHWPQQRPGCSRLPEKTGLYSNGAYSAAPG